MSNYTFKEHDFDHPSTLFILEDKLKSLLGGSLVYGSYYKTFRLRGNENVLDFGCGGGVGSRHLADILEAGHLTCVDTSNYWMEKAGKRLQKYQNVQCLAGDIRSLDIPDLSFDVVSTIHVIHDIDAGERQGIINALSRKLKAGGAFYIKEPIKEKHGMPVREVRSLLSTAGLTETEYEETAKEYSGKYKKIGLTKDEKEENHDKEKRSYKFDYDGS